LPIFFSTIHASQKLWIPGSYTRSSLARNRSLKKSSINKSAWSLVSEIQQQILWNGFSWDIHPHLSKVFNANIMYRIYLTFMAILYQVKGNQFPKIDFSPWHWGCVQELKEVRMHDSIFMVRKGGLMMRCDGLVYRSFQLNGYFSMWLDFRVG
jgi:hypothetical protein